MKKVTHWFKRPAFSQVNSNTSEEKESDPSPEPLPTNPPSSSVFDQLSPKNEQDAETQLKAAIYLSTQDDLLKPPACDQSFQSVESGSFSGSQRIIKNGKEIVISSDGEDTDSICSLEDPENLFAPASKKKGEPAPMKVRKITSPKKWKYDIDALVLDAVDDNEVEANVARYRANLVLPEGPNRTGSKLNESTLISALGKDEDSSKARRTIGAVRRTEALDRDRAWFFFDDTQKLPPAPQFPQNLTAPGTMIKILNGSSWSIDLFCQY